MTCAKQLVTATVVALDGRRFVGTNACVKPQAVCPRAGLPTGQGYELCTSVCEQQGHAEVQALRAAGKAAVGATVYLQGHDYGCNSCIAALRAAGVAGLVIGPPPDTRPQFEDAIWAHYQGLKAKGWAAPEEGDPSSRESLFWLEPNGQYGVRSVEAAWRGWQMRETAETRLLREAKAEIEWWIDEHPCCRGHQEDLLDRIDAHLPLQNV